LLYEFIALTWSRIRYPYITFHTSHEPGGKVKGDRKRARGNRDGDGGGSNGVSGGADAAAARAKAKAAAAAGVERRPPLFGYVLPVYFPLFSFFLYVFSISHRAPRRRAATALVWVRALSWFVLLSSFFLYVFSLRFIFHTGTHTHNHKHAHNGAYID
jgi:hypothetical protein